MIVGFTGSRHGMFYEQQQFVEKFLIENRIKITQCRHGECVGADEQFHLLVEEIIGSHVLHLHPPYKKDLRSTLCQNYAVKYQPLGYLARDRQIVNCSDILIGTPVDAFAANPRSGTWYTLNFAKSVGTNTITIMPDGEIL